MNKKSIFILTFLIGICQSGYSQILHKIDVYHYSFETTVEIERYDTESKRVIGYENNDLAVDTEIFYLNEVSKDYFDNLAKTTEKTATLLSLYEVKTAQKLTTVAQGYYVRAIDIDGDTKNPVFVVVMYHPEKKIIYETTIYCYDNNVEEGERIAKSFRLTY